MLLCVSYLGYSVAMNIDYMQANRTHTRGGAFFRVDVDSSNS